MAERLRASNPEFAQKKEGVIFKREWVGAGIEYGGLGVAVLELFKSNPIGVLAGLGLWVGGRWVRYGGKKQ